MGGGPKADLTDPFWDLEVDEQFRWFGRFVGAEVPLYGALAEWAADDEFLCALAGNCLPGQPAPNVLFGAVRFLLLRRPDHPLAPVFESGEFPADVVGQFRDFCREHQAPLGEIVAAHRTQTNEVGRAVGLLPALLEAARRAATPLGLIEVGASAGLLLQLDRFHYDFGGRVAWGDPASPVRLHCELRGRLPVDPGAVLPLVSRVGVDLRPLDPQSQDDADWLLSLVWPGHQVRQERLAAALRLARQHPVPVIAGSALESIDALIAGVPAEATPVILHSFSLFQWPEEERTRLAASLRAARRPVLRVWLEWFSAIEEHPELRLIRYGAGQEESTMLATMHHHGAWLDWH